MARGLNGSNQFLRVGIGSPGVPLTTAAWFWPSTTSASYNGSIIDVGDGLTAVNGWWMYTNINTVNVVLAAPAACNWGAIGITLNPAGTIAFANALAAGYSGSATTRTVVYNCNGGNYMFAFITGDGANDYVTTCTYAGVSMALITKLFATSTGWIYLFGLANPAAGANNLTVNASAVCGVLGTTLASYSGVSSAQPDSGYNNFNIGQSSIGVPLSPNGYNTWGVVFYRNTYGAIGSCSHTVRASEGTDGVASVVDTNGVLTPSILYTYTGNQANAYGSGVGGVRPNQWNHGVSIFASGSARQTYLNGGGSAVETTTINPTSITDLEVGIHGALGGGQYYFNGNLAEVAVWQAALTTDEVTALYRGYSPQLVRPASLLGYWPFMGDYNPEPDLKGWVNLVTANNPTKVDHIKVIRRNSRPIYNPGVQNLVPLSPIVIKPTFGNVALMGRVALQPITAKISLASAFQPRVTVQKLIACIAPESWENHFLSRLWSSPQAQINAGYPRYCQPTALTGIYEEVADFGGVFSNVIVNLNWAFNNITGSVSISPFIATSTDGVTFTPLAGGSSQFAQSVRYVKVHFDFAAADDKSIAEFFNLQVLLDVKNEIDGGEGDALAGDVGGTVVLFNKDFKSVKSITVSAKSAVDISAAYDFTSTPNPTGFKVLLFNATGARVSGHYSWKARGVI